MDFSLLTSAVEAVKAATSIGRAALAQRDANLVAAEVAQLNDLLLQAQERLFAHSAQLLALQQEYFESTQKLRKAEEALAERGRYTLVDVVNGQFAYRVNVSPQQGGAGEPGGTEPLHYVCQPCFDSGRKVVLRRAGILHAGLALHCSVCEANVWLPNNWSG